MITPNNKVVLIDFGIARIYKESQEGDTVIIGSKGYIAPEQLANIQSNVQSDIYSLGATMFFMLTGKSVSLPAKHIFEENFPAHVPKCLVGIIQKALALESEKRYSDVKSIISQLNANIADDDKTIISNDDKTIITNSRECSAEATETVLRDNTKHIKRKNLIIVAVLVCIILLVIFRAFPASNKVSDKKEVVSPVSPKTNLQPVEEVQEKDTIINGMLNINNPILLNSSDNNTKNMGKSKEKDKDKDKYEQFVLNPAASIYNSKFSISLTSIVRMDDEVIAVLKIQNTDDDALKLDLSKTYLVNGKNEPAKIDHLNSNNLVLIPGSTNNQELKLYFKDFNFEGSPYLLKTVLISTVNKNINLDVEVKGNFRNEKDH